MKEMPGKEILGKRITICGAGTLGGNLAENLARIGFCRLTVIDRDRAEERNLSNQPYFSHDVGQPKVKALSASLFRAVGAEISGVNKELSSGNGEKLLGDADLVVDTFDNEGSRRAVKEVCEKQRLACLHAGISDDGYGEVIWNEEYKVPGDGEEDPCEKPVNRNLSLLVVAVATEAIYSYLSRGEKKSYGMTLKDLTISQFR